MRIRILGGGSEGFLGEEKGGDSGIEDWMFVVYFIFVFTIVVFSLSVILFCLG